MPSRIEPSRAGPADFDAIYDDIARNNSNAATEVPRALDRFNCSRVSQD